MYSKFLSTLLETDIQVSFSPVHESEDYLRVELKKQLEDQTWLTATFKSSNPSDLVDQWDSFRQVALWMEKQAKHASDIVMSDDRGVEVFCPGYLSSIRDNFYKLLKGRVASERVESIIQDRLCDGLDQMHVIRVDRSEIHIIPKSRLDVLHLLSEQVDADGSPLLHIGDQFVFGNSQYLVQNRIQAGDIYAGVKVFIDAYSVQS